MAFKTPNKCPVCKSELKITKLKCDNCNTKIEGEFKGCDFCKLSDEQVNFLKTFLKCRGSIKEVEKELEISYPTVKGKLNKLVISLGLDCIKDESIDKKEVSNNKKSIILGKLENGEISVTSALEELGN